MNALSGPLLLTLLLATQQPAAPPIQVDAAQVFRDVETLAADAMEGRQTGTEGGRRARAYIVDRLKTIGVAPVGGKFERPFTFTGRDGVERTGTNVLGLIPGTRDLSHYTVVTAHYDHIGIRNGVVFNGADDNASGVAALLAVATAFTRQRPAHSLLIVAVDAEEAGLKGAAALLQAPPVPVAAMVVNVNIDMVGRDAGNRLFAAGVRHSPFLRPYLETAAQPPVHLLFGHDGGSVLDAVTGDDWTRDSDHYLFHQAGIPFVYFGVEDAEQHHRPTDDSATIGREFLAGASATVIAAVRAFDAHLEEIAAARARH